MMSADKWPRMSVSSSAVVAVGMVCFTALVSSGKMQVPPEFWEKVAVFLSGAFGGVLVPSPLFSKAQTIKLVKESMRPPPLPTNEGQ